ncbi:MAG: PstS family phosphate ABC transporter substrate-binding protein [Candidatus Delongbacteria bacterium]|jgi:phosphate transport system substrate-binding protein|nr:PstS family phosphate ABC transporter substrate-binding protein [Candidatus Delongbacteria bacterium]
MKKIIFMIIMIAAMVSFAKKGNQITMVGSTTVLPIAQATAEVYMDLNPDINISVRGGGSGVGVAGIIAGTCDIGNASRHIKNKEILKAKQNGIEAYENVVANDGIAIIVHKSNPVKDLTLDQLEKIYTGEIMNWKEVGGPKKPIVLVSRDVASGTYEVFSKKVLRKQKLNSGSLMLASNSAVATTIKDTKGAVGYVGIGYLTDKVNDVRINGIAVSEKTIQDKTYPIARTLHMYTKGKPAGKVKKYIDFILSKKGQNLVEEMGFVKVK